MSRATRDPISTSLCHGAEVGTYGGIDFDVLLSRRRYLDRSFIGLAVHDNVGLGKVLLDFSEGRVCRLSGCSAGAALERLSMSERHKITQVRRLIIRKMAHFSYSRRAGRLHLGYRRRNRHILQRLGLDRRRLDASTRPPIRLLWERRRDDRSLGRI